MSGNAKKYQELFRELCSYEEKGIYMEMEGREATPTQIVKAHMLREQSGYMRDYVMNEKGDVKELYFIRINV